MKNILYLLILGIFLFSLTASADDDIKGVAYQPTPIGENIEWGYKYDKT